VAEFARGLGHSGARKSRGGRPPERIARAFVLLASGVGNNPDAIPPVRGANGESRDAVPPSIIPERGQVSENSSETPRQESWHVLHDDDAGSKLANEPGIVGP
jgi:hypothetical protein